VRTDKCGNTRRRIFRAKEAEKKIKCKGLCVEITTNMAYEMYDYTGNNWNHRNSNKRFKEKFGSHIRKAFNRFTIKDSYTWDITYNTESTAV
jgi:hypothetical protein